MASGVPASDAAGVPAGAKPLGSVFDVLTCDRCGGRFRLIALIQQSARHLARFAQVIAVGGHAPDHPIHPAIPETRYLKALTCRVVHE